MHRPSPAQHPKPERDDSLFGLMKAAYRAATKFVTSPLEEDDPLGPAWNRTERRRRARVGRARAALKRRAARRLQAEAMPPRVIHSPMGGKINFRRSDPRHPMYDVLRARGWVLEMSPAIACGPGGSNVIPLVVGVHSTHAEVAVPIARAFILERLPVPKCLRVLH